MADDRVTIFGGRPVFGRAPAQGELLVGDGAGLTLVDVGISEAAGVVTFSKPLEVDGTIESTTGGFVFPDGSTQTTAASSAPPAIADGSLVANISGGVAPPAGETLSDFLDSVVSSAQGSLLVRGATQWDALAPGAVGSVLQSQGAGADLAWGGGVSHKTADQSITSTTFTDITELSFPVEANTVYRFRATVIIYAGAGGFRMTVNGPASPVRVDFAVVGPQASVTSYGNSLTSAASTVNALPAVQGVIHNGANAGTVTLQLRQDSANAAPTVVKSGSWIKWQELA